MEVTIPQTQSKQNATWESGRWVFPFTLYLLASSMVASLLAYLIEGKFSNPPSPLTWGLASAAASISFAASLGWPWWRRAFNGLFQRLLASRIQVSTREVHHQELDRREETREYEDAPKLFLGLGRASTLSSVESHLLHSFATLQVRSTFDVSKPDLVARLLVTNYDETCRVVDGLHDLGHAHGRPFQLYVRQRLRPGPRNPYGPPREWVESGSLLLTFLEEINRQREEIVCLRRVLDRLLEVEFPSAEISPLLQGSHSARTRVRNNIVPGVMLIPPDEPVLK
jgi:hypothetical protein